MAVYLAACGVLGAVHRALGTPGQHGGGGHRETATKTVPDRTAQGGCSIESSGVPSGRMEISRVKTDVFVYVANWMFVYMYICTK